MYDLLLQHGTVVDGTGTPAFQADVAVKDGRIVALRDSPDGDDQGEVEAARVIDCTGQCVSPGWGDFPGHADWTCLDHTAGLNLLIQGCTLTVAGNGGLAPAPVSGPATELRRRGEGKGYHTSTIDALARSHPQMEWSFGDFLTAVEQSRPGV